MTLKESYASGVFCWTDLRTNDEQGARAFYSALLGWEFQLSGPEDRPYWMATLQGKPVAGMFQAASLEPYWSSYVSVSNLEATCGDWEKAGGRIIMPPVDADGAGRIAVCIDPVGATLALWQPGTHPGATFVNVPGSLCWNELNTRNPDGAKKFYGDVLGWTFETDASGYTMIKHPAAGGGLDGGILNAREWLPADYPDFWSVYFAVEDTDSALEKIKSLGGSVQMGPTDVAAGRFAVVQDPQGASFNVIRLNSPD
jgi:predicted enzyme related to lactoylglutathione lyase